MPIEGGFILKARAIFNSEVAHAPPHVREVWDWLLLNANHKPQISSGRLIGRGQLWTSYDEIREALHWYVGFRKCRYSKAQICQAIRTTRKGSMITTLKTTRGMVVTIVNYDKYQDPEMYDRNNDRNNDRNTRGSTINKKEEEEKKRYTSVYLSSKDDAKRNVPVQEIVDLYHEILPALPRVLKLTPERKRVVVARWGEEKERQNLEWWRWYFKTSSTRGHLMGDNSRGWKADFDFLVKKSKMLKILEGSYGNGGPPRDDGWIERAAKQIKEDERAD